MTNNQGAQSGNGIWCQLLTGEYFHYFYLGCEMGELWMGKLSVQKM